MLVEREPFSDVLCLEVSDPLAMCLDISAVTPPHPLSILLLRVIKLERLPANSAANLNVRGGYDVDGR